MEILYFENNIIYLQKFLMENNLSLRFACLPKGGVRVFEIL